MIINPLAEHIDLRDHYLAFIDLEKFGLEKELQDERCTQKEGPLRNLCTHRIFFQVKCEAAQGHDTAKSSSAIRVSQEVQPGLLSKGFQFCLMKFQGLEKESIAGSRGGQFKQDWSVETRQGNNLQAENSL